MKYTVLLDLFVAAISMSLCLYASKSYRERVSLGALAVFAVVCLVPVANLVLGVYALIMIACIKGWFDVFERLFRKTVFDWTGE